MLTMLASSTEYMWCRLRFCTLTIVGLPYAKVLCAKVLFASFCSWGSIREFTGVLFVDTLFANLRHSVRGCSKREVAVLLSDSYELAQFCERAKQGTVLAVDTEFIREKSYWPQLCLIQLATADEIAIVDPLAELDLTPLADLLAHPQVIKVFHACRQDIEALLHELGRMPEPVFDTQIACEFVGQRPQLGYSALVQSYCGVQLPKTVSLTDWSLRPLSQRELSYAEDDVRYLPGIYTTLVERLHELNRMDWVQPEMKALTNPAHYVRDPQTAYKRLRKSNGLTRRQLAVAKELAAWRETTAAQADIPRRWLMRDEVIVELAKRCPTTAAELTRTRGCQKLSASNIQAILQAIEVGLAHPVHMLPETKRHTRSSVEQDSVVDLMYALLRIISEASDIAPQVIATRDDLLDFAFGSSDSPLREGWRYELVGKKLERLLVGELGLTVKDGSVELL